MVWVENRKEKEKENVIKAINNAIKLYSYEYIIVNKSSRLRKARKRKKELNEKIVSD